VELLGLIFLMLLIIAAVKYDKTITPILNWFKKNESSIKKSSYRNLVFPSLVWIFFIFIFFNLTEIRPKTNIAWLIIILIGPLLVFGCIEIFWIFLIPFKFIVYRIPYSSTLRAVYAGFTLKYARALRPIGMTIFVIGFYVVIGLLVREIFFNESDTIKGFLSRHFN
jgi:hypothetical protein